MSPRIIAEIASSHYGDVEVLHDLTFAAFEAGADGVKIQVWREPEIRQHKAYDNLKKFELSVSQWRQAARTIKSLKMELWVEVYGHLSYQLAINLQYDYGKAMRRLLDRDKQFLNLITRNTADKNLKKDTMYWRPYDLMMYIPANLAIGVQNYPTTPKEGRKEIEFIKSLGNMDLEILYACHQHPLKDSAYTIPLAAYQAGADIIEKHICLDRKELSKFSRDHLSSFEPDEFTQFVKLMKDDKKVSYIK